jgi:HAD superfamily hydrolase (TIGR01509 family)
MRRPADPAVLLDLDGTLVDSVYHHVLAWDASLREHGHELPLWRIHRGIGMGSERILPWLLGRRLDEDEAATLKEGHVDRFLARGGDLRPTDGARELLDDLASREVPFLVATSAGTPERKALLAALGREDLEVSESAEVGSSKPAPDLLHAAYDQLAADTDDVTMVGDSPWDAEAAVRAGARAIGVRTGGFAAAELVARGADDVVDAPRDLVGRL